MLDVLSCKNRFPVVPLAIFKKLEYSSFPDSLKIQISLTSRQIYIKIGGLAAEGRPGNRCWLCTFGLKLKTLEILLFNL